MKNVWKLTRFLWLNMRLPFLLKLVCSAVTAFFVPASLMCLGRLADAAVGYIQGSDINSVYPYLAVFVVIQSAQAVVRMLREKVNIYFNGQLQSRIGQQSIDKFLHLDYSCFESAECADIINRMGGEPHEKVGRLYTFLLDILTAAWTLAGLMALFSGISVWLTALLTAVICAIVWLDFRSMNMMNTMFNNQSEDERYLHYYDRLLGDKHTLYELRIYGAVRYIVDKWRARNDKVLAERLKTTIRSKKYFAVNTCLLILWSAAAMAWLGYSAAEGMISVGLCVSLIGSVPQVMEQSETLSYSLSRFVQNQRVIDNYCVFLELPERPEEAATVSRKEIDEIEFRGVSFTYPGTESESLHHVSLTLRSNENIAVVGANGAGKSTFVKLLCGIYRPTVGRVLINGADAYSLPFSEIHKIVAAVFQDFPRYQFTIRENITLGADAGDGGEKRLLEAVRRFSLQEVCAEGVDRPLGKLSGDGIDLSGGQWQRVALARGYFSDTPFLVMDEPTAALDPIAEDRLYREFRDISHDRGCVIVSHRLASARLAGRILVFDGGRVTEDGTHEELLGRGGMYAEMYRKQSSWYQDKEAGTGAAD